MFSNRSTKTRFCKTCKRKTEHVQDLNHAVKLTAALSVFSCLLLLPVMLVYLVIKVACTPWFCQSCHAKN